jgi:hypothetical protein
METIAVLKIEKSNLPPLLRPQPPFRYFIMAGMHIIGIAAGNHFIIGQLHPPAAGFFALEKHGILNHWY